MFQPEEDEETRKYRLEIEKQKALREKVLRDKETRRRKAAEEISQKDEVRMMIILLIWWAWSRSTYISVI